jgi:hypothetical protein
LSTKQEQSLDAPERSENPAEMCCRLSWHQLVRCADPCGDEVSPLENFHTDSRITIAPPIAHPRFELRHHVITLSLDADVDRICNRAWLASPVHYPTDRVRTTKTGIHCTMNVLALAERRRARNLQDSISKVCGAPEVNPQHGSCCCRQTRASVGNRLEEPTACFHALAKT